MPTLIINGKQDGVITPQEAEAAHAGIKNSQLVLLDNCGHFPFAEQPAATTAAILAFVKQQHVADISARSDAPPALSSMMLPMAATPKPINPKQITATWEVDENGNVHDIRFRSSGNPDIDQAIRSKILSFRFKPAVVNGQPQKATLTHTFVLP